MTGLLAALVGAKLAAVGPRELFATVWSPIAFLWQDAAILAIAAALEYVCGTKRRLLSAPYAVAAGYVAVTVPVLRVLSTPLTWPMLQAAGGPLADSIFHYATVGNVLWIAALAFSAAAASRWPQPWPPKHVVACVIPIVALGPMARRHVDTRGLDRNAFTALININPARAAVADARFDWRRSFRPAESVRGLEHFRGAAKGRNIVMISLESTAAQYLGLFGATPGVMPNLSALAESAIVFENAYSVYPESIKGLFSTLCSMYPAFNRPAETYADVPCRSVADEAAAQGYRTALFHSGRFRYLGMNAVIRNRGYELLADAGDIGGNHESSFGVDEPATLARALQWIDSLRGDRFFMTYLPVAGHHPYATAQPGPFRDDTELGRYRNALHEGDAALGTLIRGIRARGIEDETVWLVFGDHGEAFGQHPGNYGHTFQLYEENVHVPLLIAAPGLISGPIRSQTIASLLDVAPTLLDFVGIARPASYAGVSLFERKPQAALFFADYSLGLLGIRDGELKLIYELNSGRSRLFDVAVDPEEKNDVAANHADTVAVYVDRLKRWLSRLSSG